MPEDEQPNSLTDDVSPREILFDVSQRKYMLRENAFTIRSMLFLRLWIENEALMDRTTEPCDCHGPLQSETVISIDCFISGLLQLIGFFYGSFTFNLFASGIYWNSDGSA